MVPTHTQRGEQMNFVALVAARRSCRAFLPDPVPREALASMIEAARLAPSACNRQPWRFAVVTAPLPRLRLATDGLLPGIAHGWVRTAPALIVMGMSFSTPVHRFAPLFSGVNYPWLDMGIAGEHLALQATALGLGTCWLGWIRSGAVRRIVGWPRSVRPVAMLAVGWPAEAPEQSSERLPASAIARWIEHDPDRPRP